MSLFTDLLGDAANYFAINENIDAAREAGETVLDTSTGLANTAQSDIQFQPFSVTGPGGMGISTTAEGGGSITTGAEGLTSQFQNLAGGLAGQAGIPLGDAATAAQSFIGFQDPMAQSNTFYNSLLSNGGLGDAQSMLSSIMGLQGADRENALMSLIGSQGPAAAQQAEILAALSGQNDPNRGDRFVQAIQGTPIQDRQQSIFNQLEAMAQPERDRQNLQLEERLFAQGRGGVRDARFGGTPEQLALAKAQQEAINSNAVSAIEQARAESALRGQQTQQGLSLGLNEQAQRDQSLLQAFGIGSDRFNLNQQGNIAGIDAAIRERLGLGQLGLGAYDAGIRQQGVLGDLGLGAYDSILRGNTTGSNFNLDSLNTALAQQNQGANLANMLLGGSYQPLTATTGLLDSFGSIADIVNANQRAGVNYGTGLQQTGLQALMEAEALAANLTAGRNAALAGAFSSGLNTISSAVDGSGGFLDWLF